MKQEELFKDRDLILRINFKTLRIGNIRNKLIENGWVIKEEETTDGIKVTLYESQEDVEWFNHFYEDVDKTSDGALKKCLKVIRDYYKRVY